MKLSTLGVFLALLGGRICAAADLQSLEDRLQIEQLAAHYAEALDTGDTEAYAALFTQGADLEVDGKHFKGWQAIRDLIQGIRKALDIDKLSPDARGRRFGPTRHIVSNLVVDLKGNTATSQSYWTFVVSNGQTNGLANPPSVLLMGRYEDELVKQNDQWLFSRRVITDLSLPRPASMVTPAVADDTHLHDHQKMDAVSPTDPPMNITINPEARVSVTLAGALPQAARCGTPVAFSVKIVNQGFVTSRLEAELVAESPAGATLNFHPDPLKGVAEELRTLYVTLSYPGPTDVTIGFRSHNNAPDLGGRDRIHFLMRCLDVTRRP